MLLLLPGLAAVRPVRAPPPPVYRVRLLRGPRAMASRRHRRAGQERARRLCVACGELLAVPGLRVAGGEPAGIDDEAAWAEARAAA